MPVMSERPLRPTGEPTCRSPPPRRSRPPFWTKGVAATAFTPVSVSGLFYGNKHLTGKNTTRHNGAMTDSE